MLEALDKPLKQLPGIGPARARLFERLGVGSIADLLLLCPRRYEDRSRVVSLVEAAQAGEGLVEVEVTAHTTFPRGRTPVLKILVRDQSADAALVCFGRPWLARTFPVGRRVRVYGQFQLRYGELQSSTFELEGPAAPDPRIPDGGLLPVYPLTEGLTQRHMRDAVRAALALAERHPPAGTLPPGTRIDGKPALDPGASLAALHRPRDAEEARQAVRTLALAELYEFQLAVTREAIARRRATRRPRPSLTRRVDIRDRLPFRLTDAQERVLAEILADMEHPYPMARLLQGDVGCGKTVVAMMAACRAIERGEQAVLMVPTELLARQHAANAVHLLSSAGVRVALVAGQVKSAVRAAQRAAVRDGEIDLIVGTHALFSEGLEYANLGLVIIDEQHRFGVAQREAIASRGVAPDILMMSATPIPRSLALTAFGDSEVSTIDDLPPGRRPVETHLVRMGNEERVYRFVRDRLAEGRQAYFVYPAIEETTTRGLRSAEEMAARLERELAPYPVAVLHSRIGEEERSTRMDAFAVGEIKVLVATSVVEVGVDVANATCMVIEHAELFGLSALHQLRGRVGRGTERSYCFLVYQEPISDDARERLRVLYGTQDGFAIAEEDLRIRGPGELLGVRQAGRLAFRIADLARDTDLLLTARDIVRATLAGEAGSPVADGAQR